MHKAGLIKFSPQAGWALPFCIAKIAKTPGEYKLAALRQYIPHFKIWIKANNDVY